MQLHLKTAFKWVYEWITVITASITGLLWAVPEFFLAFDGVDVTPILPPMPPETVVKITTVTALVKAVFAFFVGRARARQQTHMDALFKEANDDVSTKP